MAQKRTVAIVLLVCLLALVTGGFASRASAQRPDPTPTTTPAPGIVLPEWLRDPNAEVFVAFAYDNDDTPVRPTFINAGTGERFIIDWPYVDEVGWVQAADGLYMRLIRYGSSGADNSTGFNEYVSIQTGDLTRLPLSDDRAPQDVSQIMQPLDNGAGLAVSLTVAADIVPASRDDNYTVSTRLNVALVQSQNGAQTTIGEWSVSRSRVDQFSAQWLAQGAVLGLWAGRQTGQGIIGEITVYDADGQLLMRLSDVNNVRWFQGDEPLILYTQRPSTGGGTTICRGDVAHYRRDCNLLTRWQTENSAEIRDYDWSQDGQSIIFSYKNNDTQSGGLCVYNWEGENAHCPVEHTVDSGAFAGYYTAEPSDTYGVYSHSRVWDTNIRRDRGLCVLHRDTLEADCITDDALPPDTYYTEYRWSPSRQYLAFTYTGQEYAGGDGLCIFDTHSATVTCPVSGADLQDRYIEAYSWSPDSRYIAIMYTDFGPLSDDKSYSSIGIVDVENGSYRDEGSAHFEHRLDELWRPPPE